MGKAHDVVEGLLSPIWPGSKGAPEKARRALGKVIAEHFLEPRVPELHHYTTAEGLLGMVGWDDPTNPSNTNFRASLVTHQNDFDELMHGQDLLRQAFREFKKDKKDRLAGVDLRWLEDKQPEYDVWTNIYTVSFCEEGDLLSQWRGYAGIRGYRLTFKLNGAQTSGPLLAKVRYRHRQKQFQQSFMGLLEFYEEHCPPNRRAAVADSLRRGLGLIAALFKRPEFEAENEWRFVQWCEDPGDTKFRASRSGRIVPYHDIAVPKATFPVTRIMFGPGFHETTEKKALCHLRDRCKLGDIPIEKTNLSYRAD